MKFQGSLASLVLRPAVQFFIKLDNNNNHNNRLLAFNDTQTDAHFTVTKMTTLINTFPTRSRGGGAVPVFLQTLRLRVV